MIKIYEMNEEEIKEVINKYLEVKIYEKKKYGEVFTPVELINNMLDKLPKKIWSDYSLKWLDPTAGVGNFMMVIYLRLMEGLKSWKTNKEERSKHIIENMLYMVEINKKNADVIKKLFGGKVNLFCGDFLAEECKNWFCDDYRADIVVGNPPFQDDYAHKSGSGGKSKLYERIFLKALMILNSGGYLTFITPDNIFSGNGVVAYNTLLENNVIFVSFNDNLQEYFPSIQQKVCFFLLQKTDKTNKILTLIENIDGKTFKTILVNRPLNPIRNWNLYTEGLTKKYISNERNNAIYNRGKQLKSYRGNKYPIIYTMNKMLYTNNIDYAVGFGVKKAIIFLISPNLEFKMDYMGKYGIGPNTFYISFDNNKQGKVLEKFLNSSIYKTLALATKTSRQFLKIGFIEYLNLNKIMKQTNKNNISKKKKIQIKNKTKKIY
jgi:hypothetical protein